MDLPGAKIVKCLHLSQSIGPRITYVHRAHSILELKAPGSSLRLSQRYATAAAVCTWAIIDQRAWGVREKIDGLARQCLVVRVQTSGIGGVQGEGRNRN